MDLEEIEEAYRKQLEDAEKIFLKAVADKKGVKEAEKTYKAKVKAARDKYYSSINAHLEKEKKSYGKKNKKTKREDTKPFKVEPGNFELSWWQRQRLSWGLYFFKKRFATRNKMRKNTPKFVSYQYYKWKLFFKKFYLAVADAISRTLSELAAMFKSLYEWSGDLTKKVLKYLGGVPGKLMALLNKIRGKKAKAGEKKEGEEKKDESKESEKKEESS